MKRDVAHLESLARLIRFHVLSMTAEAGSGHPSSSLSAVELMTSLMFSGVFRYNVSDPDNAYNDRLIFSKGHASPLFYALWALAVNDRAGTMEFDPVVPEELLTYRIFGSRLEGHPTLVFPYTEAATGSLGQGLSIGVGMALSARLRECPYATYVLLGDSEVAEGSVWEAASIAAEYELSDLVAILDVNRLGQRGETMYGHDIRAHQKKWEAFGWRVLTVDGHSVKHVCNAYVKARKKPSAPTIIIARTLKGKGVSFMEDKEGWHGKAPSEEELQRALLDIGEVDTSLRGSIALPPVVKKNSDRSAQLRDHLPRQPYTQNEKIATRHAYGSALARLGYTDPRIVALDAEVSNSTFANLFKEEHPERFFEMFVAEQNMVGTALGMSRRGEKPFVSTFAAFFSRAYDQIRMAQYSGADVVFVGSHAGVSIGQDGSSQMGLEDLALFRSIRDSVVLYPCDAVSTEALVELVSQHRGISYIRTTRGATPVLYADSKHSFTIGGSCVLKEGENDDVVIVGAGIVVHEALKAHEELKRRGVKARVIDLYSIKPLDEDTLIKAAEDTGRVIVVEDHYAAGGIGEAVSVCLSDTNAKISLCAVTREPKSGTPEELLEYVGIDSSALVSRALEICEK